LTEFLQLMTADQLIEKLRRFQRLPCERVAIDDALQRTLAEDLLSPEDLPVRSRSAVDGYAVHAEDTFGASDSIPALLEVAPAVEMGVLPDFELRKGQAAPIPTGGFLPDGADAIVMVEYANAVGANSVEIMRPLSSMPNVMEKGEDCKAGERMVAAGSIVRPYEIGLLAALGISDVAVHLQPRVAVISTGDEVVSIESRPRPGQIRDANSHSTSALIRAAGGIAIPMGIVPDDASKLRTSVNQALAQADVVAISGGSSVGTRDLIVDVVGGLPGVEVLAHGVAIRPGKPTLLAARQGTAVFGLPGHPVSSLIVAQVFLTPFLRYLQGQELKKGPAGRRFKAELSASIHATLGLEEFVRVRWVNAPGGGYVAHPVFGKSSMLSTMVKANGVVVVPASVEGLTKGEIVEVVEI
jgi:molybdopterin molybdotransferase